MPIFWTIVIGFVVGLIARVLKPGNDPSGFIVTTILGIVGAFVASFLGQFVGLYKPGETAGFAGSVIGAIIVLYVWSFVRKKKQA